MESNSGYEAAASLIYNHFKDDNKNKGFVTVIVGAGASQSLKTEELKDQIKSNLDREVLNVNAMVHLGKHPSECTLEELFFLYSRLRGEKNAYDLLNKRKDIYRRSDQIRPTIAYEFLAHLVHHKLVHNIITTNFDEELEISLDDEIGKDNYRIVKSLSEFDAFRMELDQENEESFNIPMLFKVHGTISYPRTIRATIENVKRFEEEKHKVIKCILCNTKILIIIGFSFRDEDFRLAFSEAIIEKAYRETSGDLINIFWIHRNENQDENYKDTLKNMIRRENIRKRIPLNLISNNSSDFLKNISRHVEIIDECQNIPTIARQNIRNTLLNYSDPEKIISNKFYIEILIFAMTVKGLFGIDALTNCIRLHRYCQEIKRNNEYKNFNPFPYQLLVNLMDSGLIKKLNVPNNIYFLPETDIKSIADSIIKFFCLKGVENRNELESQLIDQLNTLNDIFDVDVVEPDINVYLMFKNPIPIRNHMVWEEKTKEFVNGARKLQIIAQTGEWITKNKNKEYFERFLSDPEHRIELITCEKLENAGMHSSRQDQIEKTLQEMGQDKITIRYLPWPEISEHVKISDNDTGMYMKRIAKSSIVAPVWIEGEDCKLLKEIFEYYWNRASSSIDH